MAQRNTKERRYSIHTSIRTSLRTVTTWRTFCAGVILMQASAWVYLFERHAFKNRVSKILYQVTFATFMSLPLSLPLSLSLSHFLSLTLSCRCRRPCLLIHIHMRKQGEGEGTTRTRHRQTLSWAQSFFFPGCSCFCTEGDYHHACSPVHS